MTYPEVGHRNYVAHNARFSSGLSVFQILVGLGLTSDDRLCDVGCGSLRVGRYLITHLEHGLYYAIEPNLWLVEEARRLEIGTMWEVKQAHVEARDDFSVDLAYPGVEFKWVLISSVLAHASHAQMRQALVEATKVAQQVVFDTVPNGGPDNTEGWQYPQVASHYDQCVATAALGLGQLEKLTAVQSYAGEQWWRLRP